MLRSSSRFLTEALTTGTDIGGPEGLLVAWSKNCTRTLPRSSGIWSSSCCSRALFAAAVRWRLLGGGRIVAILAIQNLAGDWVDEDSRHG